jgi:proteasome beta subunit
MAFQGLIVVPLFAGYDEVTEEGRLYSFDVVGGRYEEEDFGSTGSGSRLARSYLRTSFSPGMAKDGGVDLAVRALVAAAIDDTATGGPDLRRGILPNVVVIDSNGLEELNDAAVRPIAESALESIR